MTDALGNTVSNMAFLFLIVSVSAATLSELNYHFKLLDQDYHVSADFVEASKYLNIP